MFQWSIIFLQLLLLLYKYILGGITMRDDNINFDIFSDTINSQIIKVIKERQKDLKLSQKEMSKKSGISQPTISKLMSKKSNFSLDDIIKISKALDVNLLKIASASYDMYNDNSLYYSTRSISESDNFVINPSRQAFKGYIGNTYYVYYKSTISSEEKIIEGKLEFSSTDDNTCSVNLKIYTGNYNINGQKIYKEYIGNMIISLPLSTCYISLVNQQIGEISYLTFAHMFVFNSDMLCRMGAVLTTSAGEHKRPTLHRMLISKVEFDLQDENDALFLDSQLNLNNKNIILSAKNLENLEVDPDIQQLLDKVSVDKLKSMYYVIDENQLLSSNMNVTDKINAINKLRKYSITYKNNKINDYTNSLLFSYVENKIKNKKINV